MGPSDIIEFLQLQPFQDILFYSGISFICFILFLLLLPLFNQDYYLDEMLGALVELAKRIISSSPITHLSFLSVVGVVTSPTDLSGYLLGLLGFLGLHFLKVVIDISLWGHEGS